MNMKTSQLSVVAIIQLLNIISLPRGVWADGCVFVGDDRPTEGELVPYQRLKPLFGHKYKVDDKVHPKYTYDVGICTNPVATQNGLDGVGAVQIETVEAEGKTKTIIHKLGYFNKAKIITGSDWVYLEYTEGDPYGSHCSKESRRAVIMITCDETVSNSNAKMELLEENNNMTNGCYYLFELSHKDICPGNKSGNLSLGSIFIIVLFSVIAVYLFFGFLYQRFVLGAKGMEQIPNYGFWQDFGNLQADGCNFVCRSGGNRGPRTYKGVGDDQLEEVEERDDHLLPM